MAATRAKSFHPEPVDWVNTALVNHDVPVALICTDQFAKLKARTEKRTGWTSEQLEHRVKRYKKLSSTPTKEDLKAVAAKLLALDEMPDVIHHDERPRREWRLRESGRLQAHPPFHDLSPVLYEVTREQEGAGAPTRACEDADACRPGDAVDEARPRAQFLVLGHPVRLEQVVSDELSHDCEYQRVVHKYWPSQSLELT
jgi:hypothetical protein